jgi:diacylglycerol kinase (CTP)
MPKTPQTPPSAASTSADLPDYSPPVTRSTRRQGSQLGTDLSSIDGSSADERAGKRQGRKRTSKVSSDVTTPIKQNGKASSNGFLAPAYASKVDSSGRIVGTVGLIPAHKRFRGFIHRHEVPRKLFHASIGLYTSWLYATGVQTHHFALYLLTALVPILSADFLRHNFEWFNRLYVNLLGFMMRESEYKSYNGVVWFIVGSSLICWFLPKDVAVMSVICLAWCDTAASTFGRAFGKYTPKVSKNKSLAGTLAAGIVGFAAAIYFWGYLRQNYGPFPDDLPNAYKFKYRLELPLAMKFYFKLHSTGGYVEGTPALIILSLWTGFVGAAAEAVDLWGLDDNLTIPILSGAGIYTFLSIFG